MLMVKVIVTSEEAIEEIIERVMDRRLPSESVIEKTYSINQVAKMLKRSHKKVSDLVAGGILRATVDNRVYESSIKEYNQKK